MARAGCRKPSAERCDGEQVHGPQHQVNVAASSEKQSGGRAAHVTVKATPDAHVPKRASGPGGVRTVARVQGSMRNRRDPSQLPKSRQGVSYKPSVKSSAAERKSEGIIVVVRPVQQNAGRAKGPYLDHVSRGSMCKGMTGPQSRSKHPVRRWSDDKARAVCGELWSGAKRLLKRRTRISGSRGSDTPRVILRRLRQEVA